LDRSTIDLIFHPVRLRIMSLLTRERLTTQAISAALPDVPTSSIYRHLKLLLESGLIAVAETRPINGIEEKVYTLRVQPRVTDPADMAGLTQDEHLHYFTVFVTELLHGYMAYLDQTPQVDMGADRVGYTTVQFYATPEEFDAFSLAVNQALLPLLHHGSGAGRELRKLAIITHPERHPPEGAPGETGSDDT
jgi:DNA-binding transcriptional ArsR family regulator